MADERARPVEEALEALAAGIAHEVRNPLNALEIHLRILEEELHELVPDRGAHVYAVMHTITRELRSLDHFVSEFLRFARPPALRLETAPVGPLLKDLATLVAPECGKGGVALELSPGRAPLLARVDRVQLKHALLNLMLNALQATPTGGRITVAAASVATVEGGVAITVRDTGEGMAPEVAARVFELFFTTREGGTGLGLPIARRIVEAHGGTLHIESRVGAGTEARVVLPRIPS
jgi:signal transduction histidine kinase